MYFKIKDVALIIGVSEQYIRIGLQRNLFSFGKAIKCSNGKYKYEIYTEKFIKFLLNEFIYKDFSSKKICKKDIVDELKLIKYKIVDVLNNNINFLSNYEKEIKLLEAIFEYEKSFN